MEAMRTGEALAELSRVLDRVESDRSYAAPVELLGWVRAARVVRSRVEALTGVLIAEADRLKSAESAAGTPLASWLGTTGPVSRREAAGAIRQAREVGGHAAVAGAAVAGAVSIRQARAISGVLDDLAPELDRDQQERAEQVMLGLAAHLDADQLAKSAGRVLREVLPGRADDALETRLQRDAERAHRRRSLRFFVEGASVRFDGSLPRSEAELWMAQLDGHAERSRRTMIEHRDPLAPMLTPEQRRADALIGWIRAKGTGGAGGPATRVLVLLDHDRLAAGAAGAGVLAEGTPLSAGELRRACCDAAVVPVVLGAGSVVLDVGREARLVTPELRAALVARDRGCVFPGCDAPPARCEAHHVRPWWAGGRTALSNLVLLCHSHHPIVEPARFAVRDQWQVRIAADGLPEFVPPARIDHSRTPVRHPRHQQPAAATGPPAA